MKKDRDEELEHEIRTHLDLEAEERVANGMSETDARYAARRAFGNVMRTKEDVRAVWTRRWLDEIVQDVRYALRTLRKSPGFTTVAVLTLALGIGANTAIFSVVNAAILQPLGYPQPEQLRFLTTRSADGEQGEVSAPEYFELTELNQSFSVVGAFVVGEVNLWARDRPRRATRARVNAELLEALAVPPERGRWFRREETRFGGPAVAILSHELWRSTLAAREDMVGQSIEIDGVRHEVVGIMPPGFDLMDKRVELWLPLQLDPAVRQYRSSHFLSVLGRLKNGVAPEQAEEELASLVASWGERVGVSGHVFTPGGHVMQMEPVLDEIVGSARRAFWVLQAAVGLVLLIACANLANLLVARAEVRRREVAVRTAIGAGRRRLLAQFVAEGLVLSVLGGAVGVVIAWTGVRALTVTYPESIPRVADITIDPAVLGFTLLVSVMTGVVFGLAPLGHLPEGVAGPLLNDRTRGTTATRPWVRRALVAGEVALAVVLVTGAGLMVRTVLNLMTVDAGFERSRLVTFGVALPAATYPTFDQRVQLYRRLIDRFGAMPGIDGVSTVSGLPPQREHNGFGTDTEDYTPPPEVADSVDYYQTVTSGYFETMGIPIVRGRTFQRTDRTGAPVAVVNEAFVRTFWKGIKPIGRRVRPRFGDQTPWVTVIGVAKDVKQAGVDQATGTEVYFLLDQLPRIFPTIPGPQLGDWSGWGHGSMHIMLRSALPAATLQPAIADAVREADPSLPIIRLRNMDDVFRDSVRRPRMLMQLFAGFAGLALLLAAIGTYGVLSYMVTQHRHEIGIRMALGAERAIVLRTVIGHGLKLTCVGLVAGLAAAFVLTRLMETLLFEVRPNDPATLAAVAALITAVAATASLVPAVCATRVDPIVALRDE
ncbi:MAG: FtsX-like permease family protein [Luteitalea sp.]|nr:FtsX-like permease family protein [Luteitalea sp.]